jgi:DnaJ-domain-containing protein 1
MSGPLGDQARATLEAALALSHRVLAAADQSDMQSLVCLDTERLRLLESLRLRHRPLDASEQAMVEEICRLNDQAIGLMEHQVRRQSRALDVAAVGRRAVAAYWTAGQR